MPKTVSKHKLSVRVINKTRTLLDKVESKKLVVSYYPLDKTCQIPKLPLIYEQYFGKTADGCFIEIGAYDGEYVSNTSGLADIGWRGVYAEPVPSFYDKCKKRHSLNKNISVVNTAVGDEEGGSVTIQIGGALSTADQAMKDDFEKMDWAKSSFDDTSTCDVSVITLNTLLENENISKNFDVLVIDVEGFEWNVLQGFDIQKWAPKMIIIELHDQNDDYFRIRNKCINIVNYLDSSGYKVIWKDFTNTIYVPVGTFPMALDER